MSKVLCANCNNRLSEESEKLRKCVICNHPVAMPKKAIPNPFFTTLWCCYWFGMCIQFVIVLIDWFIDPPSFYLARVEGHAHIFCFSPTVTTIVHVSFYASTILLIIGVFATVTMERIENHPDQPRFRSMLDVLPTALAFLIFSGFFHSLPFLYMQNNMQRQIVVTPSYFEASTFAFFPFPSYQTERVMFKDVSHMRIHVWPGMALLCYGVEDRLTEFHEQGFVLKLAYPIIMKNAQANGVQVQTTFF